MHYDRLNVVQGIGTQDASEICTGQLNLLSQSVEHMVNLEVIVQDGRVCGEMPEGDPLLEHMPILHIDYPPQLERVDFGDEVPQARTEGLAESVEELSEAGDVFLLGVALDEECISDGPMCQPIGQGDLAFAGSHYSCGRRSQL